MRAPKSYEQNFVKYEGFSDHVNLSFLDLGIF